MNCKVSIAFFIVWLLLGGEMFGQTVEPSIDTIQAAVIKAISTAEASVVAIGRGKSPPVNGDDVAAVSEFAPQEFGAGVVVDRSGLVLTNYHLLGDVETNAYKIWNRGKAYFPIQVVAADPWTDLAILKIDAEDLSPIEYAPNNSANKGTFVVAIGNPYEIQRSGSPSSSWGIISNVGQRLKVSDRAKLHDQTLYEHGQLIQSDSMIKTSTSGGPLINLDGKIVGLITSIEALSGFNPDTTYAIHLDEKMQRVISELKQGRVPEFGFLGVTPVELQANEMSIGQHGVRIAKTSVHRHTPAAKAGLELDDIITHVDNTPIHDAHDLYREISLSKPGDSVLVKLRRTDPFLRRTSTLRRQVELAKKANYSVRTEISSESRPSWRGVMIDYPTVSVDFDRMGRQLDVSEGVLVVSVESESVAEQAGIRNGDIIFKVGSTRVNTPASFYKAIRDEAGTVELELSRPSADVESIELPAASNR